MSQSGCFLVRARNPRAVASILRDTDRPHWDLLDPDASLDELIETQPDRQVAVVLSIPDYYPYDADELERYRQRLLAAIPPVELAKLHDDPRGVFVFDPMVAEGNGATTYDEVIAACANGGPSFGLWFDPARPVTEQGLPFEQREMIDLGGVADELRKQARTKRRKPKKNAAAKAKATRRSGATKKPAAKAKKKPATASRTRRARR